MHVEELPHMTQPPCQAKKTDQCPWNQPILLVILQEALHATGFQLIEQESHKVELVLARMADEHMVLIGRT